MKRKSREELVRAALAGSEAATNELFEHFTDSTAAYEIGQLLLSYLPSNAGLIEGWLQAIVEIHPKFAAEFGREFIRRSSRPKI